MRRFPRCYKLPLLCDKQTLYLQLAIIYSYRQCCYQSQYREKIFGPTKNTYGYILVKSLPCAGCSGAQTWRGRLLKKQVYTATIIVNMQLPTIGAGVSFGFLGATLILIPSVLATNSVVWEKNVNFSILLRLGNTSNSLPKWTSGKSEWGALYRNHNFKSALCLIVLEFIHG